jgi:hypothetical protein
MEQVPRNLGTTPLIAVEYAMVVGDVRRLIGLHALERRARPTTRWFGQSAIAECAFANLDVLAVTFRAAGWRGRTRASEA